MYTTRELNPLQGKQALLAVDSSRPSERARLPPSLRKGRLSCLPSERGGATMG